MGRWFGEVGVGGFRGWSLQSWFWVFFRREQDNQGQLFIACFYLELPRWFPDWYLAQTESPRSLRNGSKPWMTAMLFRQQFYEFLWCKAAVVFCAGLLILDGCFPVAQESEMERDELQGTRAVSQIPFPPPRNITSLSRSERVPRGAETAHTNNYDVDSGHEIPQCASAVS